MLWPGVCPSVRLFVCHKLVLYWNSCIHHRANKHGISGTLLQFIPNYPTVTPLVLWLQLASFMEKANCYNHLTWAGDRWSISAPITFCIHSRIVGMTHPLILYLGIHTKTLYISKHSHPVTCSNSYEQVSAVTDKSTRRTASRQTCCKQRWMLSVINLQPKFRTKLTMLATVDGFEL